MLMRNTDNMGQLSKLTGNDNLNLSLESWVFFGQ